MAATRDRLALAAGLGAVLLAECVLRPDGWLFTLVSGLIVVAVAAAAPRRQPARTAAAVTLAGGAAAVVSLVAGGPSQPGAAATMALYLTGAVAARHARPATVTLLAAAGSVVLVIGRIGLPPAWAWALALLGLLGWVLALGAGLWLRVADGRRAGVLAAVRREERLELARELHDVVAHHVAAIVVQAQAARLLAGDGSPPPPDQLAGIENAGTEALAAMRRVIGLLRDDDGAASLSGPERVADLVRRFAEVGPPVEVEGELDAALPPPVAGTVYRLVQEGLTNVRLHAPAATRVRVSVRPGPDEVSVSVADDGATRPAGGQGTVEHHSDGHGLVGMRERVEALGGRFRAGPEPASGWAVRAVIPLEVR